MIYDLLLNIGQMYAAQIRYEFEQQGHRLSEKTWQSIKPVISFDGSDGMLTIEGEQHLVWLNKGRKKGRKKVPIDALLSWMRRRNFPERGKEARKVAFAIQAAIHREGIPTAGSYRFSKNDKRKGFIDDAAKEIEPRSAKKIEAVLKEAYETAWTTTM